MSSLHRSVYQCSNCCCIQFCYQCCIMDHPEMQSITNASKRCMSCRRTVTIRLRNYKMPATTYNAKLFHTLHICRHRLDFFMLLQGWEPCKYWKIGEISLIRTLISVIIYIFLGSGGGEHLVYFDTCFWSIYVKEEFPPATKLDIVPVHNSEQVALV